MSGDSQMKDLAELVFIGEIVKQTKIANRAAERLKTATDQFDGLEVWCSIQSILVAAGNVSKILWPSRKTSAARGEKLRARLEVDDRNPLSDREIRNHFEHYDERIEDWFKKSPSAVYRDSSIDPFEPIWGNHSANLHRAYNPLTQTLTFRGESVDLAALLNALEDTQMRAETRTTWFRSSFSPSAMLMVDLTKQYLRFAHMLNRYAYTSEQMANFDIGAIFRI